MFISDPIFKFHNLFYKQVALLISYRSAQTSENILQNRSQRQITVSFNRYYLKMLIFWWNKKGELRLYQLAWTNSLLNKSHMVDYHVFHLSFLIFFSLAGGYMKSCGGGSVKCKMRMKIMKFVTLKVTPKKPDFNLVLTLFLPYEAVPLSRFQSKQGFFAVTKTNKIK